MFLVTWPKTELQPYAHDELGILDIINRSLVQYCLYHFFIDNIVVWLQFRATGTTSCISHQSLSEL